MRRISTRFISLSQRDQRKKSTLFYSAALEAGGTDNGAPGYRPQYDAGHYAAFVLDLDGNNIEAVYREPKPVKDVGSAR